MQSRLQRLLKSSLGQASCPSSWIKTILSRKLRTNGVSQPLGRAVLPVSVPALRSVTFIPRTMVGFVLLKPRKAQTLV